MGLGFGGGLKDGENLEHLSDLHYGVVADAEGGERELVAGFFAADQELYERADAGGIKPGEFFEIEDEELLRLLAQRLVEARDSLKREAADECDRFNSGA